MLLPSIILCVMLVAALPRSLSLVPPPPPPPPRVPTSLRSDPVEKLFNFFFGGVEESPSGLARFNSTRFPEQYPCTKTEWADVLPGDVEEEGGPILSFLPRRFRPMLKNTNMEARDMALTFDADVDGWSAAAFHERLDRQGACLVVAETAGGEVVGGYNPKGYVGLGEYRGSLAAFLFKFDQPPGTTADDRPLKLQKVGGAGLAQVDNPEGAVSFGVDSFVVRLGGGSKAARSKLGAYYERLPDGTNSLFNGGASAQLETLRVYTGVYEEGEFIPFSDAEPFALN